MSVQRWDDRAFVDALRAVLGLRPLYRQPDNVPPYDEIEFGTLDTPAALVQATTPTQYESRFTIRDHFARNGKRVGAAFHQVPVTDAMLARGSHVRLLQKPERDEK